jgi:hypothetical protein
MTPEQWESALELVKASQRRPEGERESFIAENCMSGEEVLRAAQSLLLAQQQIGLVLDGSRQPVGSAPQTDEPIASKIRRNPPLLVPKRIGWGRELNFANPWAWVVAAVFLLFFVVSVVRRC